MAQRQLNPMEMADLSSLFLDLAHDPKLRPHVARLVHEKNPQRARRDFQDVVQTTQLQQLRSEIAQEKQLNAARELKRTLEQQRDELVRSGRYTAEQAKEIEQIAAKHGTLDINQAAVLYAHEHPPVSNMDEGPPADQRMGATWQFPTVTGRDGKPMSFADFAKDPNAAAQNAAYSLITEFKRRPGVRA